MGKYSFFTVNHRHVTPQIDCLGKRSPVLSGFNTHLWGFDMVIDGKAFISQSKPMHMTPKIDHLGKSSSVLTVSTHIYGASKGDRWENINV